MRLARNAVLLAVLGLPLQSQEQVPIAPNDAWQQAIAEGAVVRLHLTSGRVVTGRVVAPVQESIPLKAPGAHSPVIRYDLLQIDSVWLRSGSRVGRGALVGLVAGWILGRVTVHSGCADSVRPSVCRSHPMSRGIGNAVTAFGVGVGLLAGRAVPAWRLVAF